MNTEPQTEWTEIILPKGNLFELKLGEVWRYRDLVLLFVKRDLAAQFKQTILGPIWHLIQPALTTIMFLVLFNKIAGISTEGLPPVIFYMSGITIWNFFQSCFTNTSSTFVTNASIFGKVYFPRLVLPLSVMISNMVKFGIQFGLLLAVILFYIIKGEYAAQIGWRLLLIPLVAVVMAGLGLGLGIIISSLTTKYRDLTILVNFGVQLLMYITPVAYPLSFLNNSAYKVLIEWNPLSPLTEGFRYALFGKGTFDTIHFVYSLAVMFLSLLGGILIFNKVERNFMDTV